MFFNDAIPTKLANLARGTGEPYVAPVEEPLPYDEFDDASLVQEAGGKLVWDIEVYPNYFLIAFKSLTSGKVAFFELSPLSPSINHKKLYWIATNFQLIGFNSLQFDEPLLWLAYAGGNLHQLNAAARMLIHENARSRDLERTFDYTVRKTDHIDLIEVAPLRGSLKLYAARLHTRWMQELPYPPERPLTREQAAFVKRYCVNDLDNTALLYNALKPHITLREKMGAEFGIDLRSRSDAQLAQEIINAELRRASGTQPKRPGNASGSRFFYKAPAYLAFTDPALQEALVGIQKAEIVVGESGHVICPQEIEGRTLEIGGKPYKIGMGGLHSQEKCQALVADENTLVIDSDVRGYYPNLMLKNGFSPPHLGEYFSIAYQAIVDKREIAKAAKDKETDGILKIGSNGVFGKTSDPFSTIYSPSLTVQTTLTGQLSLLMLIEWLHIAGITVGSANTDGIVIVCPKVRYNELQEIIKAWQDRTSLEMEETRYAAIYSRDVNNYIAIKEGMGKESSEFLDERLNCKGKGVFCERGSAQNSVLSKNPEALIITDAVMNYLKLGTPIEDTINSCDDIKRFVSVRNPKTGAYKDGVYLGKVIRWYYKLNEFTPITTPTGNKVPKSEGAWPLMILPKEVPTDLNRGHYIAEAYAVLREIGVNA